MVDIGRRSIAIEAAQARARQQRTEQLVSRFGTTVIPLQAKGVRVPRFGTTPGVFDVRLKRFLTSRETVQRRVAQLVKKGGEGLKKLKPKETAELQSLRKTVSKPKLTRIDPVTAPAGLARAQLSQQAKQKTLDQKLAELEAESKVIEDRRNSLFSTEKTLAREDLTGAAQFNVDVENLNQDVEAFNQRSQSVTKEVQAFNRDLQRKAARGEIILLKPGEKAPTRIPKTPIELLETGIAAEVTARRPIVGVQPIEDIGQSILQRTQQTLLGFGEIGAGITTTSIRGFQILGVPTKPDIEKVARLGRAAGITAGAAIALPEAVLFQAARQTAGLAEEVFGKVTGKVPKPTKFALTDISEQIVRGAVELPFGVGTFFGAEEAVTDRGVFITPKVLAEFTSGITLLALPAKAARAKVKAPTKAKAPTKGLSAIERSIEDFVIVSKRPGKKPPTKKPPTTIQKLIARERIQLLGEKPIVTLPKRFGAVPEVIRKFRQAEQALLETAAKPLAEKAVAQRIKALQTQLTIEKALKPITTEIQFQRQLFPSLTRQARKAIEAEIRLETAPVKKAITRIQRKVGRKFSKVERRLLAGREDVLFNLVRLPKIRIEEAIFRLKREIRLEVTPVAETVTRIEKRIGRKLTKAEREFELARQDIEFALIKEPKIKVEEAIFRTRRTLAEELQLELRPVKRTTRRLKRKFKRRVTKPLTELQIEFEKDLGLAAQDIRFSLITEPRIRFENVLTRARRDIDLELFFARQRLALPVEQRLEAFQTGFRTQVARPLRKKVKGRVLPAFFATKKQLKTLTEAFGTEAQAKIASAKFAAEAGFRVPIRQVARAQIAAEAIGKRVGFELGIFRPFRPGIPILEGVRPRVKRPEPFRLIIIEPKKGRGLPSFKKNIFEEEIKGSKTIAQRITIKEALGIGKESAIAKALGVKQESAIAKALGIGKESKIAKALKIKEESAIAKALKAQQKSRFGKELDGFVTVIKPSGKIKPMKPFIFPTKKLKPKKEGVFFREFKAIEPLGAGQIQITKTGAVQIQKVKEVTKVKVKPKVTVKPPRLRATTRFRIPTIEETISFQPQRFRDLQRFRTITLPTTKAIQISKVVERQRTLTPTKERIGLRTGILSREIEAVRTIEVQRQALRTREALRFATGFPPTTILREVTRPKPPKLIPIVLPLPEVDEPEFRNPVEEPTMGFNVFIRRKGKLIRRNKVPLTRSSAFGLGFLLADESVARSGVVREAKKKGKSVPALNAITAIAFKFRKPKGKTKLARDSFVERSRFAIDSIGELQGITARGRAKIERNRAIRGVLRISKKRKKRKRRNKK